MYPCTGAGLAVRTVPVYWSGWGWTGLAVRTVPVYWSGCGWTELAVRTVPVYWSGCGWTGLAVCTCVLERGWRCVLYPCTGAGAAGRGWRCVLYPCTGAGLAVCTVPVYWSGVGGVYCTRVLERVRLDGVGSARRLVVIAPHQVH